MARAKFQILLGMHEHPESYAERGIDPPAGARPTDHELLYPGDIREFEEALVNQMPPKGWLEPIDWHMAGDTPGAKGRVILGVKAYGIRCAKKLPLDVEEETVARAEPSKVIGINISEKAYNAIEQAEDDNASVIRPALPAAQDAPASVRPRPRSK